ncbi:hypothetical protein DXG01_001832 [Tephrocybe rancida]|nr:hypothetical protein DXG01_001832 [Tephrocybe rancida]
MEQIKADSWTLGPIPSVTSTFKVSLTDGHLNGINAPVGKCGLGWQFIVEATDEDVIPPLWGSVAIIKRTLFKIHFAPHRVASDELRLRISITVDETVLDSQEEDTSTFVLLPGSKTRIHLATFLSAPNFTGDTILEIQVDLPPEFNHEPDPRHGPTHNLHYALAESLIGAEVDDVKFCLFTRRGKHDVTNPAILFSNSSMLHGQSPFLDELMSDVNTETVTAEDLADPIYAVYDYTSDSDLESESDSSDSDVDNLIDLESQASTEVLSVHRSEAHRLPPRTLREGERAIFVRDTAFETWKALVFYLYTKEIHFKPLTSSRGTEASEHVVTCSPKSMYRLATKIGYPELQALSLKAIVGGLSESNILEEMFSHFSSLYPEVQKAEVDVLVSLLTKPAVVEDLKNKMRTVAARSLPHAQDIVATMLTRMIELALEERTSPVDDKKKKKKKKKKGKKPAADSSSVYPTKTISEGEDEDEEDEEDEDNEIEDPKQKLKPKKEPERNTRRK